MSQLKREYVDTSRPAGSEPQRRLDTWVRVPEGPGPFPVIVWAHGDSGHPRKATKLLDALAGAGYVVVAPAFPLTNADVSPTSIPDFVNQPADLTRVIDGLLADARQGGPLEGKIDGDRIGVAGHSLGGATVFGLIGDSCCRDDRVVSAVVLNGFRPEFPKGEMLPGDLPLLVVHGTADARLKIELGRAAFESWAGPRWFLTLDGATHSPHVEDAVSPHDATVVEATVLFFDATLRRDPELVERFERWAPAARLGSIAR